MDMNLDGVFGEDKILYHGYKKLNEAIMKEMADKNNFQEKSILINDPKVEEPRSKTGSHINAYINENIKVDIVDLS